MLYQKVVKTLYISIILLQSYSISSGAAYFASEIGDIQIFNTALGENKEKKSNRKKKKKKNHENSIIITKKSFKEKKKKNHENSIIITKKSLKEKNNYVKITKSRRFSKSNTQHTEKTNTMH